MAQVEHPNREKASSKAMKAVVTFLLLGSAMLIALITAGGGSELQGAQPVAFVYVLVYLVMAFYVSRWNRGVLPVAAALALLFAVIAAVAAPAWFARDKGGFEDPAVDPAILGLLTVVLVPVQLMLMLASMKAFVQKWNVEVEVSRGSPSRPDAPGHGPEPARA